MKLSAAPKHRMALVGEIGFCSTKLAPSSNAFRVVVLPCRMANVTEFLLLCPLRELSSRLRPPCRSSPSTITASTSSPGTVQLPYSCPLHTYTPADTYRSV